MKIAFLATPPSIDGPSLRTSANIHLIFNIIFLIHANQPISEIKNYEWNNYATVFHIIIPIILYDLLDSIYTLDQSESSDWDWLSFGNGNYGKVGLLFTDLQ